MAERLPGGGVDLRLVAALSCGAVVLATALATIVGSPVIILVTSYAVLFGLAIVLFGNDGFTRAFNIATVIYVTIIVFACTYSPLPGATVEGLPLTDRLNYYYIYYIGNGLAGTEENIEAGYLLLMNIVRPFVSFEVFLSLVSVSVLWSLLHLLHAMRQEQLIGIVALTLISYFSFWSGALNITRQFIAAGIGFYAISILLGYEKNITWRRVVSYVVLVLISATIHSSSLIFGVFGIVYTMRRYENRMLAVIWAGNILIFVLNYINASPLSAIPGLSDRLGRYDSSQISDDSLAQFQSAGVTVGNRIDWAAALAIPMIIYAIGIFIRRNDQKFQSVAKRLFPFALLYTVLCFPFYLLSSLAFGDRIAFYAFLIFPSIFLTFVTNIVVREVRYVVLLLLTLGCVLQMAVGLYGYTPKMWLTGVI